VNDDLDVIQTIGKYVISIAVIVGCFVLLYTGRSTDTQPWTVIGLIVGWIIRDSAGQSATSNALKIAASQPNPVLSVATPAAAKARTADPGTGT
jgi:hypothetical protein